MNTGPDTVYLAAEQSDGPAAALLLILGLIGLLFLIALICAIVSVIRSDNYSSTGKTGWILSMIGGIIPFIPLVSILLWFFWGRKESGGRAADTPMGGYPPPPHSGTAYGPQGDQGYGGISSEGYPTGY